MKDDAISRQAEIDLDELRHRFGDEVAFVVEDMMKGTNERWSCSEKPNKCEDCISRQAVIDSLHSKFVDGFDSDRWWNSMSVLYAINKVPSVSTEKTGHWIGHGEHCENLGVIPSGLGAYEWCSNCDCGIDVREWHRNNYNYCPNCGAKMEVEE